MKTFSDLNLIGLVDFLDRAIAIVDENNPDLLNELNNYKTRLSNPEKTNPYDCESYASIDVLNTLKRHVTDKESEFAALVKELSEKIDKNRTNLEIVKSVDSIAYGTLVYVKPQIENAVVNYLTNKCEETRKALEEICSIFGDNYELKPLLSAIAYERYMEERGEKLDNVEVNASVNAPKTYTQDEVDSIIETRVKAAQAAKQPVIKKSVAMIPNHIVLNDVISNILANTNNAKLESFCEQYINALNEGKKDETLYETFISGASHWNYLSAVDTEVSALKDRVAKYRQDIDLKKILEIMKDTEDYWIVPLIEEVVVDYVTNKTMQTRAILSQRCAPFEHSQFVRDIVSIVQRDVSRPNSVWLGESLELTSRYVHTESIHSPVHMINEHESVFCVKGDYYQKKGNSISKLTKTQVSELDESFRSLCNLVNSSNTVINDDLNEIAYYDGDNKAVIKESEILVNGAKMTTSELDNMCESTTRMWSDSRFFYASVKTLNENFDKICQLNFVKRVAANDNSGRFVDVFKLNENIFVNAYDSDLNRSTFYRNMNPISCRNRINEHMGIDCSPLFEDELPEQEDMEKKIEHKKKEYQDYIDSLEDKKKTLQDMKDESSDTDDIDKAIELIDKEIADTKDDFEKYQKNADSFLKGDDDDNDDDNKGGDNDDDHNDDGSDNGNDDDNKANDTDSKETATDMEKPLSDTGDADTTDNAAGDVPGDDTANADAGSDEGEFTLDDDEFKDVPYYDSDFDTIADPGEPMEPADTEEPDTIAEPKSGFEIVKVMFNRNVQTGIVKPQGEAIVMIPSVDSNGDVHNETRRVAFEVTNDKGIVIKNDYMPLDMYMAIRDAIEQSPDMGAVSTTTDTPVTEPAAEPAPVETPVTTPTENETPVAAQDSSVATTPASDENKDILPQDTVDNVNRETPAETQQSDTGVTYPISVGLYPEEIKPIKMEDFEKELDDMNIEHSATEAADGEICMKIKNRAQAHAIREYFHKWLNLTNEDFDEGFPELKDCFCDGKKKEQVNEGVKITGVTGVRGATDGFSVILPCNEAYCTLLGVQRDEKNVVMNVIAESEAEAKEIYTKLYEYAQVNTVEQDVTDILEGFKEKYGADCEKNYYKKVTVPFNGFLESKLEGKGIAVEHLDESMNVTVDKPNFGKAVKIMESFYGEDKPEGVADFIATLKEGLQISITTPEGQRIEFNTDDLNKKSNDASDTGAASDEQPDFNGSFNNVTFDQKESLAFNDDKESSDEDNEEKENNDSEADKDKKSKKDSDENDNKDSEKEDSEKGGEEGDGSDDKKSEDEKGKKKFVFKKKSKNESVDSKKGTESALNESAKPNILDFVELKDGGKGQIIYKQADGQFIVNVSGHTVVCEEKDLKMLNERPDTLECPYKFDPETLKGLYENYVECGMYLNDVRITSGDCRVKLLEYVNAKDTDEITLVNDGSKITAIKKYVRLHENINDVLDMNNYIKGTIEYNGAVNEAYINKRDFINYNNIPETNASVRVLIADENKETHLRYVPGGSVNIEDVEM